MAGPTIHYACTTHKGRIRDLNEDSYCAHPEQGLWLIADGMGGNQGGEIASSLVVQEVHNQLNRGVPLRQAIAMTHQAIKASTREGHGARGMGSTVVALKFDQFRYEVCWVGDSRAYLWDNGSLVQLTRDHSYVQELVDSGIITDAEALHHPQRNVISRALGLEALDQVHVDSAAGDLFRGERILLCSDGLTSEVTDNEISEILALQESCQVTVDLLVQKTNAKGGRDNVTTILVEAPTNAPVKTARGSTRPVEILSSPSSGALPWWAKYKYRIPGLVIALAALLLFMVFLINSRKNPSEKRTMDVQDPVRIKKSYVPLDDKEKAAQKNHEQQ